LPRVVTLRIRVPEWISEEEVERIARKIEEKLESSIPVSVLRKILGIRKEDLVDSIEPIDWREIEEREKKRLRRPYGS